MSPIVASKSNSESRRKVLFIIGTRPEQAAREEERRGARNESLDKKLRLTGAENEILERLDEVYLGFQVEVMTDRAASALNARDKVLVVISSEAEAALVGDEFRDVSVPVIVSGAELLSALGLAGPRRDEDYGELTEQCKIQIIMPDIRLAGGKSGEVTLTSTKFNIGWIRELHEDDLDQDRQEEEAVSGPKYGVYNVAIEANADKQERSSRKVVLCGFRSGGRMMGRATDASGKNRPFIAPARRVCFPYDYSLEEAPRLMPEFWNLFDEAVRWAIGEESIKQSSEVFRDEWQEIQARREFFYQNPDLTGFDGKYAPENMVGLALSGGGIRSATFCLGLLQGMKHVRVLRLFDYFSTVSGGGYMGGWWSAWLARDQRQKGTTPSIFPARERIEPERLDDYRLRFINDKMSEGSLSAGKDPTHHLRLFANYLTPRKGALSGDTWRAAAVISRNLAMTWLILLPILLAAVLAGQFYFVTQPGAPVNFFHPFWSTYTKIQADREQKRADKIARGEGEKELKILDQETEKQADDARQQYYGILRERAFYASYLLLPLLGGIVLMSIIYMRSNASEPFVVIIKDWLLAERQRRAPVPGQLQSTTSMGRIARWVRKYSTTMVHLMGALAVGLLIFFTVAQFLARRYGLADFTTWLGRVKGWALHESVWPWLVAGMVMALILWLYTFPWHNAELDDRDSKTREEWRREVWRNRTVRLHSKLLVMLAVLAVVLAFAGFGHEIVDYLLYDQRPQKAFVDYLAKAGGWGALVTAIVGTIYTAFLASPTGGHDKGEADKPKPVSSFILAITPLLVLVVLMVLASWAAHEALRSLKNEQLPLWPLTDICFIGIATCLGFSLYEMKWRDGRSPVSILLSFSLLVLLLDAAFVQYGLHISMLDVLRRRRITISYAQWLWLMRVGAVAGWFLIYRMMMTRPKSSGGDTLEVGLLRGWPIRRRTGNLLVALACAVLAALTLWRIQEMHLDRTFKTTVSGHVATAVFAFMGITLCLLFVVIETIWGKGHNKLSLYSIAPVYGLLMVLLLVSIFNNPEQQSAYPNARLVYVAIELMAALFAWVVALGWMADPNTLSMHSFYKGRLVRAYMGASNPQRIHQPSEITEAVAGDDVLLTDLRNCQRGAPYHLMNATLNLVGGRDLATAQRSSAMFVFSKLYCGSFRTGYRWSGKYMDGRLSLGTAVATSGAAVSPGMGAGKTTASLAMLMTLLNVRLGYWAPTPGQEDWRSPQARLWPFYIMREFLSQTNDLSNYCYLTDGGHFDNTGLYSLVERGCRYIVFADCAADPEPCFSDLGNAIRRCRIDFGASIDLDITPFIKQSKDDRFVRRHFSVGTIVYSEEHALNLGWGLKEKDEKKREKERTGIIVYIKPSLLKDEKNLSPDVRQYEIENSDFPQQSTVDQWFDEAQFESYRQLGEHCARETFGKMKKIEKDHRLIPSDIKDVFDSLWNRYQKETSGDKSEAVAEPPSIVLPLY